MHETTPSTAHQELELKWAISHDDSLLAQRLLQQRWGPGHTLHQHNRFYDTVDGALREQRMSIRLRRENERVLLTCKQRKAVSSALHQQQEEECWVNTALWSACSEAAHIDAMALPLPPRIRAMCGRGQLRNLGGFYNLRHQWQIDGETICLDHSRFSEHFLDWEIEIEIPDASAAIARENFWRQTFSELGIQLHQQPRSKLHRFIEGPLE